MIPLYQWYILCIHVICSWALTFHCTHIMAAPWQCDHACVKLHAVYSFCHRKVSSSLWSSLIKLAQQISTDESLIISFIYVGRRRGCCGPLCLLRSSIYRKANGVNKEDPCVNFRFVFMMNRRYVVMIFFSQLSMSSLLHLSNVNSGYWWNWEKQRYFFQLSFFFR